VYKVLVRKPDGKRPLGQLRHSWEDGIRIDLGGGGSGFSWLRIGTGVGSYEYSDKPSDCRLRNLFVNCTKPVKWSSVLINFELCR
jgi:hypothetical protein